MNFTDSLDRQMEEVQRPINPPTGNYIWQIDKHPEIDTFTSRAGDEYERITFNVTCVEPCDDVDPDELEEYGNVAGFRSRKSFMLSTAEDKAKEAEGTIFNTKRFLEHAGVDVESGTLGEAFASSVGGRFRGELKHRPSTDDPEVVFVEIGRTTTE